MSIVAPQHEIVNLRQQLAAKDAIIEAQKRVINEQQAKIKKLQLYDDLHSNSDLPENMRSTAVAIKKLQEWAQPDENGYLFAHLPTLAKSVGTSPASISRGLIGLETCTDVLKRRLDPIPGEPQKHTVHLKISDLIDCGKEIKATQEVKRHGGKRIKKCELCHSTNLIEEKVIICQDCHHRHETKRYDVNAEAISNVLNGDWKFDVETYMDEPAPFHHETTPGEPTPLQLASNHVNTVALSYDAPVSSCNGIPEELKAREQWACHVKKVPHNANSGANNGKAKVNDQTTWTTYDQAQSLYEESQSWIIPYDGIGYMLTKSDPYAVVDYDHCRDKETGLVSDQARQKIDLVDSYAEISLSGTGVHQWARASIPRGVKRIGIEMYDDVRFIVCTGQPLPGTPGAIEDRQEQMALLYADVMPIAPPEVQPHCVYASCSLTDKEVLENARKAENGPKFAALWEGSQTLWTGPGAPYRSQSEADLALCRMLAYWTDNDGDMVDKLFRQSPLCRVEKWDRAARAGETYGEGTIRVAIGSRLAVSA